MTRPAFQFYPSDWRKDNALRSASIGARGLWMELCCVMHECEPYGHLTAKSGDPMDDESAAQLCGVDLKVYRLLLAELERKGVSYRTAGGLLYSRRMVKDEKLRLTRSESGSKGGNPNLVNQKDNQGGNQNGGPKDNQDPTPSASSASSSASIKHAVATRGSTARPGDSHGMVEKINGHKGLKREKWGSLSWAEGTSISLNLPRHTGERDPEFCDRMKDAANAKRRKDAADARRRNP